MKLDSLIYFIKEKVPYTYFKNTFPNGTTDNCAYVQFSGGFPTEDSGVKRPTFQIVIRSGLNDYNKSEEIGYKLHEELTNLSEIMIDTYSVVKIKCMNSVPMFVGTDEKNRPIHSINFEMTVRP